MNQPDPVTLDRSSLTTRLPVQIQRQAQRARDIQAARQAAIDRVAGVLKPGSPDPAASAAAPGTPGSAPVGELPLDPNASPEFSAGPVNDPDDPIAPTPDQEGDARYWKQRYKQAYGVTKSQGKELQILRNNLRGLENERDEWKVRADARPPMNTSPAAPQPPALPPVPAGPFVLTDYYTSEQIEEFGEDFLNRNHRALQSLILQSGETLEALVEKHMAPVKETLANQQKRDQQQEEERQQTQQQALQDSWNRFTADVARIVPNWQQIDGDPMWRAWLAEEGGHRQVKLTHATSTRDVVKTTNIFREYLAQAGALPRQDPPVLPGTGAPGGNPSDAETIEMPFEFSARGYRQWKEQTKTMMEPKKWNGSRELYLKIEGRYNAAINSGTLPGQRV